MVLIHSVIPLNAWIVCIQLIVIALFRFALEFGYQVPACGDLPGPNSPPKWWYTLIGNVHYLHFGVILFGISAAVAIAVSYLTEPIDEKHLHRLTFWTRHSKYVRIDLDEDTQYNTTSDKTGMIFASESTDRCIILVFLSRRKNWIGKSPRSCRVLRRTIQTETVSCSLFCQIFLTFLTFFPICSLVNVNAAVIMTITAFIWGFYAWNLYLICNNTSYMLFEIKWQYPDNWHAIIL